MIRLLPVLLVACSPSGPPNKPCGGSGQTTTLVLTSMSFPRETGNISVGFDLDDDVSTHNGLGGCGVEDQVDPDGTSGIDNSFARLRPALDTTEAAALEDVVQEAINTGGVLVVVQLDDVDDPEDDSCVDLEVLGALGPPMLGTDGVILAGQTFEVNPAAPVSQIDGVEIHDGGVRAGPVGLALPFKFLDADVVFNVNDGQIELQRHSDGFYTGMVGGGVAIEELSALAHETGIDPTVEVVLDSLLSVNADLAPDDNGVCQEISVTIEFTAVNAYLFEQ